jgi:ketosteroid isomerase-like protein
MKTAKGQKTPVESGIRKTLEKMFAAWSDLDPAKASPFYAKDPGLVFFDIAPMKYMGWAEIASEVPKTLAAYRSLKLMSEDLRAHRTGNLAWATAILHGDLAKKGGGTDHLDLRYTAVLEKRRQAWLIVHEHLPSPRARRCGRDLDFAAPRR